MARLAEKSAKEKVNCPKELQIKTKARYRTAMGITLGILTERRKVKQEITTDTEK